MARPTDKASLLDAARLEHDKLLDLIGKMPARVVADTSVTFDVDDQSRNVRDVLAHLDAWHRLLLGWHADGMVGKTPAKPAAGYSWSQTPELNHRIWESGQETTTDEARSRFDESFNDVIALIESHTDDELFTKRHYPWTGSTSLGSYVVSGTSSHYIWAQKLVKQFLKQLRS